jgi:hypothetical protein
MAAITSTVIAGAGLALGAAQAIKANKAKKDADSAAFRAEAAMRGVKEENVMKQVQVPTLGYDLAQESQAQRDVSTISALQGAGAAGVIGGIGKVAHQAQRDMAVAQAGQGIEQRRAQREFGIEGSALAGAQAASAAAQAQQNQAIEGMFSSALSGAGSLQTGLQASQMTKQQKADPNLDIYTYLQNLGSIQNTNAAMSAGQTNP